MPGPLAGIRIIEMAGLGPGAVRGMMLADHGAEVIRIERRRAASSCPATRSRGRAGRSASTSSSGRRHRHRPRPRQDRDGLIEGFRPGVMERLGLGPDVLLADQSELVYGRMTGWGQEGPLAGAAGHDINYIALSGVLHTVGRAGRRSRSPPVNYARRFRRRRHAARLRHGERAAGGAERRAGPGDRLRDDRRLGPARQPAPGA